MIPMYGGSIYHCGCPLSAGSTSPHNVYIPLLESEAWLPSQPPPSFNFTGVHRLCDPEEVQPELGVPQPEQSPGGGQEALVAPPTVQGPGEGEEVVCEDEVGGVHAVGVVAGEEGRKLEGGENV